MKPLYKYFLYASLLLLLIVPGMLAAGYRTEVGPPLILFLLVLAIGLRGHDFFKGFSYTVMIFAAVAASLFYPSYFTQIGTFDLKRLIVPLLQIIMFGMGTAMSLAGLRPGD